MKKATVILLVLIANLAFGQLNTNNAINTGRSKLYFGNYVGAIENFNMVIKMKPYMPEPYFYRGAAKLELDDFRGAKEDLDKALEIKPYYPDAIMYRGVANYNLKDFSAAMNDYSKAMEMGGETADLLNNRGICKAALRDFDGAIADYTQSIKLKTKNFNAYLNRSIAYQIQKEWDKSIADCNNLIRIRPNSPMGYMSRGLVKIEKKDYAGALRDFDVAVSFDPTNAYAFQNRGMVKQELESYEAAIMDYDMAIKLDPYMASAYFNRGIAKEMIGRNDYQKDYDNAALLDPRFEKRPWQTAEEKEKEQQLQQQQITAYKQAQKAGKKAAQPTNNPADSLALADSPDKKIDMDDLQKRKMKANLAVEDNRDKPVFAEDDAENSRVQDKNIEIKLLPNFEIATIDKSTTDPQDIGYFNLVIDNLNAKNKYNPYLTLTNKFNTSQSSEYYKKEISLFNDKIDQDNTVSDNYLYRGLFYSLTEQYNKALEDYDKAIKLNERNLPAYFMRANTRFKMIDAIEQQKASEKINGFMKPGLSQPDKGNVSTDLYSDVLADYSVVLYMNPEFIYGYFNRGNIYCKSEKYYQAIDEYNKAIEIEPEFAEAFYNRGLVKIFLNDVNGGAKDLSRAGELGIAEAYNVLKRYCN